MDEQKTEMGRIDSDIDSEGQQSVEAANIHRTQIAL